jgi:hypothetical protein
MYSIARLTPTRARCLLIEYEQLDNLLEVVFKIKKQMKIVKFGGKSLANGEHQYSLDIERKIKQEEKSHIVGFSKRGKQLMSWTIFLLLQPKWKYKPLFRVF